MKCRDCKEFGPEESICGYVADVWNFRHRVKLDQDCNVELNNSKELAFRERSNTES